VGQAGVGEGAKPREGEIPRREWWISLDVNCRA
jgi:hypothetical protein